MDVEGEGRDVEGEGEEVGRGRKLGGVGKWHREKGTGKKMGRG